MTQYRPAVGEICPDQYKRTCGFALDRNSPACDVPAVAHLVVTHGPADRHMVMLQACGSHVRIARIAGNLVMEHEFTDICSMPGTRWDFRDNCCVIDDSGQSRAGHAALAVPA